MPRSVTIRRPEAPIRARIHLPRSKSVANRALIAAQLAGDIGCVTEPGDADDTRILNQLLRERPGVLDCGLGGTTFRFLLTWAAVQEGAEHVVTGAPRLLERPHADLIEALRTLGADITPVAGGYRVRGTRLAGGELTFRSPISSQYLSALMLVAPQLREGLRIHWQGTQRSRPYVEMTAEVMRRFGAAVALGERTIDVGPMPYRAQPFTVPRDWSAAAFWYEVAGLTGDADVLLADLAFDGLQGDAAVVELAGHLVLTDALPEGLRLRSRSVVERGPERIDLLRTPDLFQPLACLYAGTEQAVGFIGLDTLAHKESDRLRDLAESLAALGVKVDRSDEGFWITPTRLGRATAHAFATHGDHRLAMALAPLALITGRIILRDPDVVTKSYPTFWTDLRAAGFGVEFWEGSGA